MKKCCSGLCLSTRRRELALKQHATDTQDIIRRIEDFIIQTHEDSGAIATLSECLSECSVAPRTFYKCCACEETSFNDILDRNGIKTRYSKFQHNINLVIKALFPYRDIVFEKAFDDCRNTKTNYCLRFDIFIPSLNLAIECDGKAHSDKNNYYNVLTKKAGYTPTYITDAIKNAYCLENDITLIRIPYKRKIDENYVKGFLAEFVCKPCTTI